MLQIDFAGVFSKPCLLPFLVFSKDIIYKLLKSTYMPYFMENDRGLGALYKNIGVGRFRILGWGGQGLEYWGGGGGGGGKFPAGT